MTGDPHARLLYTSEAAALVSVRPATIRDWVRRGELVAKGTGRNGQRLYLEADVLIAERRIRQRRTASSL